MTRAPTNETGEERQPITDLDAEARLIGLVLWDGEEPQPEGIYRRCDLSADAYYREPHRNIWRTLADLDRDGELLTRASITARVGGLAGLRELGGAAYLAELINGATPGADPAVYVRRIEAAYRRRQIEALSRHLGDRAREPDADPDAIVTDTRERLERIGGHTGSGLDTRAPHAGAMFAREAGRIQARAAGDERPIPTPWPALNLALGGGIWPGLAVLVGDPGSGKSQLALQVLLAGCRARMPGLYVGLELDALSISARLAGLALGRPWSPLVTGRRVDDLPGVLRAAEAWLAPLPIHVELPDAYGGWQPEHLVDRVRQLRARYDLAPTRPVCVVIDYLQLVDAGDRGDIRQAIGRAAYYSREVARRHNAAVIAVSSTGRGNYGACNLTATGKPETRPESMIGLAKEAGEIEFAADLVLALAREPRQEHSRERGAWLAVAKIRHGLPTWIGLTFDGTRFAELLPVMTQAPAGSPAGGWLS